MFKIGYRTIKTAVGAAIAIGIAQWLELDFYSSAAILAILCISVTRRGSLSVSWQRFAACVIGLIFSMALFELIGYHPLALGLLLLLFIPLAVKWDIKEGIVTSCVIILHIYTLQMVSFEIFLNELLLILIGIGIGLLMNLYMPSMEKELASHQLKIEQNFKIILYELAFYLRDPSSLWDGKELTETVALLQKAKDLALRNIDNHLLRYKDHYFHYFKMREKQFETIERMLPFISSLDQTVIQGERMALFLEELSDAVGPENTANQFLLKLNEMKEEFQAMDLPQTRKEFEIRSSLFYIMHELEQYLMIKDDLRKQMEEK